MCYFLRKCIEKVTPSRFSGEVSASTVPLGPHTSHALTLLGLRPSQREHTPATPVLCPTVRSLLHGPPPCLSPWPLPTSPSAPGSSHLPLRTLLHTVLQTRRDFVSPYLISCTVWDSTSLENLQWFPVVKKKKQTSTPLQFPGPCHLSTSLPHLIWHHCLHLTGGLCVFTWFLLPDSPLHCPQGLPFLATGQDQVSIFGPDAKVSPSPHLHHYVSLPPTWHWLCLVPRAWVGLCYPTSISTWKALPPGYLPSLLPLP